MATYSYPYFGSYTAALRVTDNNTPPKTDLATLVVNEAPTAGDAERCHDNLAENVDTTSRVAVAQIQITDDDLGEQCPESVGSRTRFCSRSMASLYLRRVLRWTTSRTRCSTSR